MAHNQGKAGRKLLSANVLIRSVREWSCALQAGRSRTKHSTRNIQHVEKSGLSIRALFRTWSTTSFGAVSSAVDAGISG